METFDKLISGIQTTMLILCIGTVIAVAGYAAVIL
jgi:hypothetical protein